MPLQLRKAGKIFGDVELIDGEVSYSGTSHQGIRDARIYFQIKGPEKIDPGEYEICDAKDNLVVHRIEVHDWDESKERWSATRLSNE